MQIRLVACEARFETISGVRYVSTVHGRLGVGTSKERLALRVVEDTEAASAADALMCVLAFTDKVKRENPALGFRVTLANVGKGAFRGWKDLQKAWDVEAETADVTA